MLRGSPPYPSTIEKNMSSWGHRLKGTSRQTKKNIYILYTTTHWVMRGLTSVVQNCTGSIVATMLWSRNARYVGIECSIHQASGSMLW
jgi:hypothetical protein